MSLLLIDPWEAHRLPMALGEHPRVRGYSSLPGRRRLSSWVCVASSACSDQQFSNVSVHYRNPQSFLEQMLLGSAWCFWFSSLRGAWEFAFLTSVRWCQSADPKPTLQAVLREDFYPWLSAHQRFLPWWLTEGTGDWGHFIQSLRGRWLHPSMGHSSRSPQKQEVAWYLGQVKACKLKS